MLYPNPLSLFCAILLCFPFALILTITSNSTLTTPNTITNCKLTLVTFFTPPPPPPPPPSPPPPPPPPPSHPRPPPPPTRKPITKPSKSKASSKNTSTNNIATTNSTNLTQPLIKQPPLSPPRPPPEDDKVDMELLKRASQVNPNPPQGHPKKVAFLFLTTTPLPFAPLWELFFNQSGANTKSKYNIYIHADPMRYNPPFTGVFSGRVIPSSKPTRRNTPTLITAARRLLAHALLDDPNNYMFTLLSAACIPLHTFNFTYNTLVTSTKSFIEVLSNETTAYGRWAARGQHAMLPEVNFEDFRIGSQFWTLTRRHARVVVKDTKLWRKFRLPCVTLNTCYPEENYFPTLLYMMDPQNIVPATLTNVNWFGRYDGHPHTYNATEVDPQLIRWLRDARPRYGDLMINGSDLFVMNNRWDPFLFARKFAPNCVEPLLKFAKNVLFKD